ncbi:putative bacteriophage protein [Nitrobacter sp. Nb-311A]|nr:putative bacteriophage protein [Nitrobacter sp. Nb-311A]
MPIHQLQLPSSQAITPDITPQLSQLVSSINKGQERQTLADLGKKVASGEIDYRGAAGTLASLGETGGMMQMLSLAEAKDKLARETAASQQFNSGLGRIFGAGNATAQLSSGDPRGIRNNNPLNLKNSPFTQKQPGFTGSDGRFGRFGSMDQGLAAADNLLQSYGQRGINTVSGIINRWAPANDGNPVSAYAQFVARKAGVDPNAPIDMNDPAVRHRVVGAMAEFENGRPVQVASADNSVLPANSQPAQGGGQPGLTAANIPMLLQARSNPNLPASQREFADKLLTRWLDESKTPDKIKTLQQLKAASGYQGSILDLEKELKAAGAINIDQRAESGEAKAAGEAAGKRRADMFAAAGSAGKTLTNLSRMEGLLNQVSQGKLAPARMNISAWAKAMGLNDQVAESIGLDPKGAGSAQALQSLINESVVGKIGAGGFPANNFSDADRAFITDIFAKLGNEPRANKIIIEGARRMVKLDVERARAFQAFKRDPSNKGRGFEDFELDWAEKMAQRDVFGDLRREAESIIGPQQSADPPVEGARQARDGNFYVPDPNRPGKYLQVQ